MRGGLHRHPIIGLTRESLMKRFLKQVAIAENTKYPGAYPHYSQQWRTLWKAYRLDYISEGDGEGYGGRLTHKGRIQLGDTSTTTTTSRHSIVPRY